ncbi:MAG: B12-binding domain-containing radical SAM protein [Deltaproteobacteria bacterium]|nr:B12-binding domain-containing radical SAM protein [Deltaproteobacteria bacterium]
MKILLVNPSYRDVYRTFDFVLPPLGLAYMAALLAKKNYDVKIVDLNVGQKDQAIPHNNWDLVGITLDTSRYYKGMEYARMLKSKGTRVVVGGPHASFMADEILESGSADYVVRGEGEHTMLELAETLNQGGNLEQIQGLSFRNDDQIIHNDKRAYSDDLDTLPSPARDLLDMDKYRTSKLGTRSITSILTSRGCPYQCSFCASSKLAGTFWRARSVQSIVEEIQFVKDTYGYRAFAFVDDNFTLNPQRVIDLCEEICKRGWDVHWWCFSRVDTIVKNPEMVSLMYEAGCRSTYIGVESSNQETLDSYNKKISADISRKAISVLKENKIEMTASFIIGGLNEDKKMVKDTLRYAKSLNPNTVSFTILTPYPGTDLFEQVKDRIITFDWRKYDGIHSVIRLKHFKPMQLQFTLLRFYLSFYLRSLASIKDFLKFYLRRKLQWEHTD